MSHLCFRKRDGLTGDPNSSKNLEMLGAKDSSRQRAAYHKSLAKTKMMLLT
jgi:hypothetical protein